MGKIKGWSKESENRWRVLGHKAPYGASVSVRKNPNKKSCMSWEAVLPTSNILFNTKEQANKFVMRYMRANPNG